MRSNITNYLRPPIQLFNIKSPISRSLYKQIKYYLTNQRKIQSIS